MELIPLSQFGNEFTHNHLGIGSEGNVYQITNDLALKLFHESINPTILENKYQKLLLLGSLDLEDYALPQQIVIDNNGKFIGYTMEYIETAYRLSNFKKLYDNNHSLKTKIDYLLKLEELIKRGHQEGITIADISPTNILIDKNYNVKIIDTDNFKIGQYNCDITSIFTEYYKNQIINTIDNNTDKYAFGMLALRILCQENTINPYIFASDKSNALFHLISILDIPKETKEPFYHLFSDCNPKEYIGDTLKLLVNDNEKHIKFKIKKMN